METEGFRTRLASFDGDAARMSFDEFASLLGVVLPSEARTGFSWWEAPGRTAVWLALGWLPSPDLVLQEVTLNRVDGASGPSKGRSPFDFSMYDEWNEGIGRCFYSGRYEGRPVYLDIDEDTMPEVVPGSVIERGEDPEATVTAVVKASLELDGTRGHTFRRHVERMRSWQRTRDADFPPCLAVLMFLCLIAERMKESAQFGAANYYGRLCEALGTTRDSPVGKALVDDFTHQTHELWDGLNAWLLAEDGRRGLPTAYAFDHRRHIGRPISQSLLRQGDHERLADLFVEYKLRPGQSMSLPDMTRLMKEWVPTSRLSQTAKRLWSSGSGAQERMATVALIELAAWPGASRTEGDATTSDVRIRIALQVKRMPRLRVETSLLARAHPRLSLGVYRLPGDTRGPAAAALQDTVGALTLARGPSEEWHEFLESADVSLPDLLLGSLRIVDEQGVALARQPRRLSVFRKDTSLRYLIEIDRAELGSELALLVHRSLSAEVREILEASARPGFEGLEGGSVPGVPEDWTLFSNVQLLVPPPDSKTEEIAALIPVSWTSIAFAGGLTLAGRSTWHVAHPPEVSATSVHDSDPVIASLHCLQAFVDPQPNEVVLGSFEDAAVFRLDGLDLPDGDYEVRLSAGTGKGGFLVRNTFRLRSASTHLPDVMTAHTWIGHRVGLDAWSCVSAEVGDTRPARFVRGAMVAGLETRGLLGGDLPPANLGLVGVELEDDEDRPTRGKPRSGEAMTCLLGGGHHWLIEGQREGKRQKTTLHGYCKLCGLERSWPGAPRLKKEFRRPSARPVVVVPHVDAPRVALGAEIRPIVPTTTPDLDSLLDALCYMREGSWAAFEKLAVQIDDSPWFALETARLLSALGHVDLVINPKDLRVAMWAVAPPTLVTREDGSAVLAGFRSDALLDLLRHEVGIAGGTVARLEVAGAPSVIRIEGLPDVALPRIASVLANVAPETTSVVNDVEWAIMSNLVPLSTLIETLPLFSIPASCELQLFEIATGKWRDVAQATRPGGYRLRLRPIRYGFMSPGDVSERRMRLADNRLVKYLAALDSGVSVIAYDPARRVVRVHLGAQLPGLFERALVLATGSPPRKLVDGSVEYEGVDEEAARRLWSLIGPSSAKETP